MNDQLVLDRLIEQQRTRHRNQHLEVSGSIEAIQRSQSVQDECEYVNRVYGVNTRVGQEVRIDGRAATIIGADHHLHLRFGDGSEGYAHPTWRVEYL